MKINNAQIVVAFSCLQSLIKKGNVLPGLTGLRAGRDLRMLEPLAAPYEQKRIEVVQRLGQPDGAGGWTVVPSDDNWDAFVAEIEPMASEEHDLELYVLPIKDILKGYSVDPENGDVRLLNFSGAELDQLERLGLVSDEDAPPPAPKKSRRKSRA